MRIPANTIRRQGENHKRISWRKSSKFQQLTHPKGKKSLEQIMGHFQLQFCLMNYNRRSICPSKEAIFRKLQRHKQGRSGIFRQTGKINWPSHVYEKSTRTIWWTQAWISSGHFLRDRIGTCLQWNIQKSVIYHQFIGMFTRLYHNPQNFKMANGKRERYRRFWRFLCSNEKATKTWR